MERVGIKLNLSKCHIGQKEIKFLGHIVSKEGLKPDPGNVEAINMKPPNNVKETRRFLGMAGFYRKHIEKFSQISAPLTNLLGKKKKKKTFEWKEVCQHAFEEIKSKSVNSPILVKANLSRQLC